MAATLATLPDLSLINIFTYLPPEDLIRIGQTTSRWPPLQRAAINVRSKKSLTFLIGDEAKSLFTGSNFPKAEAGLSAEILGREVFTKTTMTRLTTEYRDLRSLHIALSSWSSLGEFTQLQVLLQSWQSTLTTLTLRLHLVAMVIPRQLARHLNALFTTINTLPSLRRLTVECTFSLDHPAPALQAVLGGLEEFYFSAPHLSLTSEAIRRLEVTSRGQYAPALRANQLIRRIEIPNAVLVFDLPVLCGLPCRTAIRRLHIKNASERVQMLSERELELLCTNLISLEVLEFEADESISMAKLAGCLANLSILVELRLSFNFYTANAHLQPFPPIDTQLSLPSVRRLNLNLKLTYHDQLPWNQLAALFPNLEQLQLAGLENYEGIILGPHCTQCFSEGIESRGEHCLRMIVQIWEQKCPRLKSIRWPFGKKEN